MDESHEPVLITTCTPADHILSARLAILRARSLLLLSIGELSRAGADLLLALMIRCSNESDIIDARHDLTYADASDPSTYGP